MPHPTHARLTAVAALVLLIAPGAAAAQDTTADWSRILHQGSSCPDGACTGRTGMIWDSTNTVPVYPRVAASVGLGGDVVLTFEVREDGAVDPSAVTIVRSSHRIFVNSAVDAVSGWRFGVEAEGRPVGGVPVEVHLLYALVDCRGGQRPETSGWAGRNQLVIVSSCIPLVPSH